MKTAVALVLALLMAVAPALSPAAAPTLACASMAPACATTSPACCENCAQCCAQNSVPQRGEQAPAPASTLTQQQIQLLFSSAVVMLIAPAAQEFTALSPASSSIRVPAVPLFVRHCSYLV